MKILRGPPENFQVRHISAEAVDCLFFEMKGTLLKLLGSIEDPYRREAASRKILALQPGPSAERWFQAITEILEELSSVLAKEREQKTGGPIPEIRRYVEEHFSEPQLNLTMSPTTSA